MVDDGTALAGQLARWLVLACTLLGVVTMHTLGHAGMQIGTHTSNNVVAHTAAPDPAPPPVEQMIAVGKVAGEDCHRECAQLRGPDHRDGMAGWGVCLAVLAGIAVLALITVLLTRSRSHAGSVTTTDPQTLGARGPPSRSAGLTLAAVSVLRI